MGPRVGPRRDAARGRGAVRGGEWGGLAPRVCVTRPGRRTRREGANSTGGRGPPGRGGSVCVGAGGRDTWREGGGSWVCVGGHWRVCELSRARRGAGDTPAGTRVAAVPVCAGCPGDAGAVGGLRPAVPPCYAAWAGAGACVHALRPDTAAGAATPPCRVGIGAGRACPRLVPRGEEARRELGR